MIRTLLSDFAAIRASCRQLWVEEWSQTIPHHQIALVSRRPVAILIRRIGLYMASAVRVAPWNTSPADPHRHATQIRIPPFPLCAGSHRYQGLGSPTRAGIAYATESTVQSLFAPALF